MIRGIDASMDSTPYVSNLQAQGIDLANYNRGKMFGLSLVAVLTWIF
jgi:hypothetical protein